MNARKQWQYLTPDGKSGVVSATSKASAKCIAASREGLSQKEAWHIQVKEA